jgi:hypothetical protein
MNESPDFHQLIERTYGEARRASAANPPFAAA